MSNNSNPMRRKSSKKRKISKLRVLILLIFVIAILTLAIMFVYKNLVRDGKIKDESAQSSITTTSSSTATASRNNSTPTKTEVPSPVDGADVIQKDGAVWNLKLVNQWNPIDASYKIPLENLYGDRNGDERMIPFLKEMVSAAENEGLKVFPRSLYRSYERQEYLFKSHVNKIKTAGMTQEEAEKKASTVVARPGTSEHNTGLAVDFWFADHKDLVEECKNTAEYAWMIENCAKFGFILRFPKGQEKITGVVYEPWHYRYVGKEAAEIIMASDMTLEEYIATTQ